MGDSSKRARDAARVLEFLAIDLGLDPGPAVATLAYALTDLCESQEAGAGRQVVEALLRLRQ